MPRTPVITSYVQKTQPTNTYSRRTDSNFLMTQALDFLMTEDENYIVLQDSYSDYIKYTQRPIVTTNYS